MVNNSLQEENKKLKELIGLIADAECFINDDIVSVKEILRWKIWGLDSVAGESVDAWNDYCILRAFFEEHYEEYWDNFE